VVDSFSHCPILFLSSKNDELDKILGLSVGGDDYVAKPFSPKEIAYRVKAQLRRAAYQQDPSEEELIKTGELEIDVEGCRVTKGGSPIELTAREFESCGIWRKIKAGSSAANAYMKPSGARTASGATIRSWCISGICVKK